jgi:hypothetical protein
MVRYEGGEPPYTEWELWNELQNVVDTHRSAIERYLESLPNQFDPDAADKVRTYVAQVLKSFVLLFRASQNLVHGESDLPIARKEVLPILDVLFLKDLFQLELAEDAIYTLESATDRGRQLLDLVIKAKPGPLAQKYLARVARCFTWGYQAETLILCRSVLEHVLEETVPDLEVFGAFERDPGAFSQKQQEELRKRNRPGIRHRIRAAKVMGKLTDPQVELADTVTFRGNKAVHDNPDSDADVFGTVRALVELIGKLY